MIHAVVRSERLCIVYARPEQSGTLLGLDCQTEFGKICASSAAFWQVTQIDKERQYSRAALSVLLARNVITEKSRKELG